jgi:hypothetical protein
MGEILSRDDAGSDWRDWREREIGESAVTSVTPWKAADIRSSSGRVTGLERVCMMAGDG